ncbi:MAG: hypothetical protein DMF80_03290 [Acidobacteria bacterium]|nr:MAG: hypothetical protein DMF80_03290 [Acidobacteriota bacterium]PYQ25946.1 MAG: hypothetical protein DMF81_00970 [Acidobacteriota bacterium]
MSRFLFSVAWLSFWAVPLPPATVSLVPRASARDEPVLVRLTSGECIAVGCPAAVKATAGAPFLGSVARPILKGAQQAGLGTSLPDWARPPGGPSR